MSWCKNQPVGIIFLLIGAGAFYAISRSYHQNEAKAWSAAATHLQLAYTAGGLFQPPQLAGTVRGVAVRVEVESKQKNSWTTVYSAVHPTPSPPVTFRRQHAMSFLRQVVGGRDVVVGDPRFDDAIVVDAPSTLAITEFLTPTRRAAIMSTFSAWSNVELTDRSLSVRTNGRTRDASRIIATVNRMVDTCRLLSDPEPVDDALTHRDEGELHLATEALHEVNAQPEPNVLTQMLEAETLVASGAPEQAVEILDDVADSLPDDPEVAEWREHVVAPIEETDAAPPLDQQSVIDDLFSTTRYGIKIDARYAEAFHGRGITWTGEVEQSRGYRSDADFGTEPGTKTTVNLGSVGQSSLFSNRVKAVIDLPEDTTVGRGDAITFTGTLLHIDRFTRTFYVRDAVLDDEDVENEKAPGRANP